MAWLLMSPFAICDMVPLARKSRDVLYRLSYLAIYVTTWSSQESARNHKAIRNWCTSLVSYA